MNTDMRSYVKRGRVPAAARTMSLTLTLLLAVLIITTGLTLAACEQNKSAEDASTSESMVSEASETMDLSGNEPGGSEDGERTGPGDAADSAPIETIFFASDYQRLDGYPDPKETLNSILAAAASDGKRPDQVVICGDYTNDRYLYDYQLSPEDSIEEIRQTVKEACPDMEKKDMLFVQGNHDRLTESIAETGLHEFDDCLIYVLNTEQDYPWKQGHTAGCLKKVKRAAKDMKACFNELIAAGESRPVFIAGHVPLHYTARTSSRHTSGDNLYARLIFNKVNKAARSLDIIYLFGHNHSKGWDCYMGGACVYKAVGDTLLLPDFTARSVDTDSYTERTLRFTYLNAGYLGYYMNCGPEENAAGIRDQFNAADMTLTGTICEIYPNRVVLTRYDAAGTHRLGARGKADPYKNYIDRNLIGTRYYAHKTRSPQEVRRRNSQ